MARKSGEKSKLVSLLAETPFITTACKKVGLPRMTFYRWMKSDPDFRAAVNAALREGRERMDEIAESALMKNIQAGKSSDIQFYLTHNHRRYMKEAKRNKDMPQLTPEEMKEFQELVYRNRSLPPEQLAKINAAFQRYGMMDENGRFTQAFYDQIAKTEEQRKEIEDISKRMRGEL